MTPTPSWVYNTKFNPRWAQKTYKSPKMKLKALLENIPIKIFSVKILKNQTFLANTQHITMFPHSIEQFRLKFHSILPRISYNINIRSFHTFLKHMQLKQGNYLKIYAKTQIQLHYNVPCKTPSHMDLWFITIGLKISFL